MELPRKDSFGEDTKPSIATIANCGTRTRFLVDLDEYHSYKLVRFWPESELAEYRKKNPDKVVSVQSITVDTGERKAFFSHNARHLKTTTKNNNGEEITDGW